MSAHHPPFLILSLALMLTIFPGCNCDNREPCLSPAPAPAADAEQLEVRFFRLAYISPDQICYTPKFVAKNGSVEKGEGQTLMQIVNHVKTARGQVTFEKRTNALVIRDTVAVLDQIQDIVDKVDIPPPTIKKAPAGE